MSERKAVPYIADDTRRWAKENVARICANQGLPITITDPIVLTRSAALLRIGKQRYDAARAKEAGRAAGEHA